jgi:hypothetical protein
MELPIFEAPNRKIKKAKKHIGELQCEVTQFIARNPYRIVVERDRKTLDDLFVIRVQDQIPDDFAVIIGDAIHNLRAALDLLACDLVRVNGADVEGVYFPFCRNGNDFENTMKQRHIDRAGPDIVNIFRSLEPYNGGNDALIAIHDLAISDKHKILNLFFYFTGIPNCLIARPDGSPFFSMTNCWIGPIKDGLTIYRFPGRVLQGVKIGQQFKGSFEITFGHGQAFHGQSVIPTLYQLAGLVDGIVKTFETHYL